MKKVLALTTSRADWGHLSSPLKALQRVSGVQVSLAALGSHLSPEFGYTVKDILADGFEVDHRVECLLSSDSEQGMAKTIGLATLSLSDLFTRENPDLLLLIADRYEMLAPASVALAHRIPVAHIEGGEVSEGAIDHAVRQALTSMSHIHFVPTATARKRLLAFGEEPWRVHQVGAPSIDHLIAGKPLAEDVVRKHLNLDQGISPLVVAWHPTTLDGSVELETDPFFAALETVEEPLIFCFPNADAGSRSIRDRASDFCDRHPEASIHVNLSHHLYWGLLRIAKAIIGNSSSGIMEAPAIELPCLNVGRRQQGRERSLCIIDVPAVKEEIISGVAKVCQSEFRDSLKGMKHAYGDGSAGERIAAVLADLPDREKLLLKRAMPADLIPDVPDWLPQD